MKNEWEKQQDGVIFKNVCNLEHPKEHRHTFSNQPLLVYKNIQSKTQIVTRLEVCAETPQVGVCLRGHG